MFYSVLHLCTSFCFWILWFHHLPCPPLAHLFGHLAGNWIGGSTCCNTRHCPHTRIVLCLDFNWAKKKYKRKTVFYSQTYAVTYGVWKCNCQRPPLITSPQKDKRGKRPTLETQCHFLHTLSGCCSLCRERARIWVWKKGRGDRSRLFLYSLCKHLDSTHLPFHSLSSSEGDGWLSTRLLTTVWPLS